MSLFLALCATQDEAAFWSAVQERLKPLWIQKNDPAPFAAPPAAELAALEGFAASDGPLPPALETAGWRIHWIPFGEEKLRLLCEAPEARRGRGMLLTRPGTSKLVLMAPHRFFDRFTGDIARGAFFRSKASAFLENTAHRHWGRKEGVEYGPGDAAHNEATALHALAKGLAAGRKGLLFAQLHGFSEDVEARAIVSDGTETPSAGARQAAKELGAQLYGVDTRRLGATENVLGRHLRGSGHRFLHVEMSLPLREAFKADASKIADVLRAAAD